MLETKPFRTSIAVLVRTLFDDRCEISRLLAAAAISQKFCDLLLNDPALALETGFQGESFSFSEEERNFIVSVRADSLADLAGQLALTFDDCINIGMKAPVQTPEYFGF
jgi:hypothetical protein